jgi:hypothetical protein
MEENKISKSWGGRRKGAGRKVMDSSEKKTIVSVYMRPEQKAKLKAASEASGLSASEFICRWLDSL